MKNSIISRSVIITLLLFIAATCVYVSLTLHNNSLKDKALKKDYFTINQIKYGMLSGSNWTNQVNRIVEQQVDSFSLNGENKKLLTSQVSLILHRLLDEVDEVLHKKQHKFKDKIKFKVINTFVDLDKFKFEIPKFSSAIVDELDKSKNKNQLKDLLKDKISGILGATNQDTLGEQQLILNKYHPSHIKEVNAYIATKTAIIQGEQRKLGYILIGLLCLTLLLWFFIIKTQVLYKFSFLLSVMISFITLFIGVSLPMIEIDARISTLDLKILSSHIVFDDQIIFFQTKSILDVIHILLTNGKGDTVFVGFLILLFSVLFPITKLISASIYLFLKEKNNKFIKYMAFKSGKWSMADVMVVAIFMAYIGFKGILDDQLESVDIKNETVNIISTNKSGLQTGFLIFVSFVLYNLALAEILNRITKKHAAGAALVIDVLQIKSDEFNNI